MDALRTQYSCLSEYILGPFATLGSLPVDILSRDLDIARLTVDAASGTSAQLMMGWADGNLLLGIDLEPDAKLRTVIFNVLVHASRAEAVLDTFVLRVLLLRVRIPILDL